MSELEFALAFASRAHRGQVDKSGADYINHPLTVASFVESEEEKIVALLHDVLEDTVVNEPTLRLLFGDRITDAVLALTRQTGESYEAFILRAKQNPIARTVKLADLRHNSDLSRLRTVTEADLQRCSKYAAATAVLLAE